ncbi:hypothetical protein JCM8097_004700 [Rhodosporidiobolus ruineniae]
MDQSDLDRPPGHSPMSLAPPLPPSSALAPFPHSPSPRANSPLVLPHAQLHPPSLHHADSAPALPPAIGLGAPNSNGPATGAPGGGASTGTRPPLPQSYSTSAALPLQRGPSPFANGAHSGGGGYGGGQPQQDTRTQLFVSNLPFRVRWQDLKDLMRKCGTVLRADVALSPTDGRSRGFGVVLFARSDDAAKAIQTYHGYTWQTRVLDVRIDAQDPTGALALAEANRQQAMQNQQRQMERQRGSPIPPPPPPPHPHMLAAYPGGTMLIPVPSPLGQSFLAPPPPPPPQQQQQPQQPLPAQSPAAGSAPNLSPTQELRPSSSAGSPYLQAPSSSSPSGDAPSSPSPSPAQAALRDRSSPSPAPGPAPPIPPPSQGPNDVPPQLQHAAALQPQLVQQQQQQQQQQQGGVAYMQVPVPMMGVQMGVPMFVAAAGPGGGAGAVGMHPMGYAVPAPAGGMHGGLMSYYAVKEKLIDVWESDVQAQQRPASSPLPAQYTNRHLFVGNLPFNCQWQELKDLMRGAGSVLRADIAQGPDGRSRGFGSVLFATPQDAERAVGMFNGYEFNGRALKVHFDKFSGAGIHGNPNQNNGSSSPYSNGHHLQHQQHHQPQQHFVMPVPMPAYPQRTVSGFEQQQQQQQQQQYQHSPQLQQAQQPQPSPLSNPVFGSLSPAPTNGSPALAPAIPSGSIIPEAAPRPSTARSRSDNRPSTSGAPGDGAPPTSSATSPPVSSAASPTAHPHKPHHPLAPSRIAMPPPLPFSLAAAQAASGQPTAGGSGGPFSPLHTRGLPPMTPSMPAFTFAPFAAPTPPLHPGALFSPGINIGGGAGVPSSFGPFSPGLGGPAAGSPFYDGGAVPQTPGWAQTPGAPGTGFNPMFPPAHGQGYQGYYQQQAQYAQQQQYGYQAQQGQQPSQQGQQEVQQNGEAGEGEKTPQDEPSYFPPVPAASSTTSPAADSTVTAAGSSDRPPLPAHKAASAFPSLSAGASASAPPLSPDFAVAVPPSHSHAPGARPGLAGHSKSDPAAGFLPVKVSVAAASASESTAALSVGASPTAPSALLQPGWAEGLSPSSAEASRPSTAQGPSASAPPAPGAGDDLQSRRRSFNVATSAGGEGGGTEELRKRFEAAVSLDRSGAGEDGAAPALQGRRASFDAGSGGGGKQKPAFGTSIWG